MLIANTVEEVVPLLERIRTANLPDQEMRRQLSEIRLDARAVGAFNKLDPHGEEFRREMLALYARLFARAHELDREGLNVDIANELAWGFPYGTHSSHLVGSFLMAYGFLI